MPCRPRLESPAAGSLLLWRRFPPASCPEDFERRRTVRTPATRRSIKGTEEECAKLSAQNSASIYVDYFAGHEGCQVRSSEQDRACDFFRCARTLQRNCRGGLLQAGFVAQHRCGHICIHPARRYAVNEYIVACELRGQTLHETDDRAFRCAVVSVKRFAALARRGAYSDDAASALRDHVRHGKVNHGVDALHVHAHHFVPLALGNLLDRSIGFIPYTGVGGQ